VLEVTCVVDDAGFATLRSKWDELHTQAESSSVFMSWAWHYTWWGLFAGPNDKLCILCVTDNDDTIAILPLYIRKNGWARTRRLMFTGTGEAEVDEGATEYLDIIANDAQAMPAMKAAMEWMKANHTGLRFDFRQLLDDSVIVQALNTQDLGWDVKQKAIGQRYRIDLHQQTDEIPMDPARHKRVKRSLRAVEREGGLQQTSLSQESEIEAALTEVANFSDQRQQQVGRHKSAFASERFNQFHQAVLPLLFETKSADIQRFTMAGDPLAVLYCFYDEHSCHYYQSGFLKSAANKYMPLTVAHLMEIDRNRGASRRYYDFMRGEMDSYKKDFSCETTPMLNIVCYTKSGDRWVDEVISSRRATLVQLLRRIGITRKH